MKYIPTSEWLLPVVAFIKRGPWLTLLQRTVVPPPPTLHIVLILFTLPIYPRALPTMKTENIGGAPNTDLLLTRAWQLSTAGTRWSIPLSILPCMTMKAMLVGFIPPRVFLQTIVHPSILIGWSTTLEDTLVMSGIG